MSIGTLEKVTASASCGFIIGFLFLSEYDVPLVMMIKMYPLICICAYILIHNIDEFVQRENSKTR